MSEAESPRVAVITGASSGIGKEAAKALLQQGWRVIGLGRDPERTKSAEAELRSYADGDAGLDMLCVDLSLMAAVEQAALTITALTDHIDVLLNNAGGVVSELTITPEGNEATFAGNHLGPFLLTQRLLPLLRKAAASAPPGATRIINVSSSGHEQCAGFDWDNLQITQDYLPGAAYCQSKLANILFARELAHRLRDEGIVAHAMHPGVVVGSNFINHVDDPMRQYMDSIADQSLSIEQGADTLVWLATAEEPGQSTGLYFHQREAVPTSAAARDDAAASRLWEASEQLIRRSLNG